MIIHQPEFSLSRGQVAISAKIEFETEGTNTPESLWFKFPEKYGEWVSPRGDGFLVALILTGMYYQEDIEVRGEVSPLLAYNLPAVIKLYHQMRPNLFKPIDIKLLNINSPASKESDHWAVGAAFSGGVDSTFTLWSHLPQNQPIVSAQITHGLFVHGMDVLLRQIEYYDRTLGIFKELFERLHLELIPASTNVYSFNEYRIDWMYGFAPPLVGTALQLERLLNRFYVSSGDRVISLIMSRNPGTALSWTHHRLSTENLRILQYSPEVSRDEKIDAIRDWPEIWGTLRVCASLVRPDDVINCCECGKCLDMMSHLEILGDLNNFTSFHKPFRTISLFRWLWRKFEPNFKANQIRRLAWENRRLDIWLVMLLLYIPGSIRDWLYSLYSRMLDRMPARVKYAIKSRIFPKNI